MNRVLYQLSYAAMWSRAISLAEISFVIIAKESYFVNRFFQIFFGIFWQYSFRGDASLNWIRKSVLFSLGGGVYVGLELLYRGRSHISMFAAGGLCFLLLGKLERLRLPVPVKALLGVAAITGVELAAGLLVNRDYSVWDYRGQRGNFLGQICPAFMFLWLPLSLIGMVLYRWAEGWLKDKTLGRVNDPTQQ